MLRKWEYIAEALKNLKAPKKVIDAAQEIDNILLSLGLDHNTLSWINYASENEYQNEDLDSLLDIIGEAVYCSACFDIDDNDVSCSDCLLAKGMNVGISCTPRDVYADDYYRIIMNYVRDRWEGEIKYES